MATTNPAYSTFQNWANSFGKIGTDERAKKVYDTASRLGIGASDVDKAFGANPGTSQKYITNAGWDNLKEYTPPSSNMGMSGFMNRSATSGGVSSFQSYPAPAAASYQVPQQVEPVREYTPVSMKVDPSQTTEGLLTSLLDSDNPYIQRARARAKLNANSRGLLNSSLAMGAAESAAIDAAMPIAQQDAQIYQNQQISNQQYQNDAGKFNADSFNRRALEVMSNSTAIKVAGIGASASVRAAGIRAAASTAVAKIGQQTAMMSLEKQFQNNVALEGIRALNQEMRDDQLHADSMETLSTQQDYNRINNQAKFNEEVTFGLLNGTSYWDSVPGVSEAERSAGKASIVDMANTAYAIGKDMYKPGGGINPLTWNNDR